MNYAEMTPAQIGWMISDTFQLPTLGAFVETRLRRLQSLERQVVEVSSKHRRNKTQKKGMAMTNIAAAINLSRKLSTIVEATADNAKAALVAINESWAHEWDYQVNDDSVDAWGWHTDDDHTDAMTWRILVRLVDVREVV